MKSRREIDTGIFIQVRAFSWENNNPTPVCVYGIEWIVYNREEELRLLQMITSILRLPLILSQLPLNESN